MNFTGNLTGLFLLYHGIIVPPTSHPTPTSTMFHYLTFKDASA